MSEFLHNKFITPGTISCTDYYIYVYMYFVKVQNINKMNNWAQLEIELDDTSLGKVFNISYVFSESFVDEKILVK